MKTFLAFLFLAFTLTLTTTQTTTAQSWQDYKTLVSADSINDIAGTDTTIYYDVRHNADWSITITTDTITGSGGTFEIEVSNDGINYVDYKDYADTANTYYNDTIASVTNYVYTGSSFPYRRIAVKTTKGTCSGVYSTSFFMKPRE